MDIMQFKDVNHNGDFGGVGGHRPLGTARDLKDFEQRVRAFVRVCSEEDRRVLLRHFCRKVFVYQNTEEGQDLQLRGENILRSLKIIRILLEEMRWSNVETSYYSSSCLATEKRFPSNKRKLASSAENETNAYKKLKSSASFVPGTWRELKLIGKGGFGSVYLVQDVESGLVCARKSIKIACLERQMEEIRIHKKLEHHNIVSFLHENKNNDFLYIYLEFVDGGTLEDRIGSRGMSESKARFYFSQLTEGVKYLHSQLVAHRDLKPANLMLSKNEVLKIGDFGLAADFTEDEFLSRVCGTPAYMAPEIFTRRYKGQPADIWSCGIILFKLLSGRNPWRKAWTKDSDFAVWSFATYESRLEKPWSSFSEKIFHFIEKILDTRPENRASISDIERNDWFRG